MCYHTCTDILMQRTRYPRQILMKLERIEQILKKYSSINVMKFSSVEAELFLVDGQKDRQNGQADGRVDNHDKSISHSSKFGESV